MSDKKKYFTYDLTLTLYTGEEVTTTVHYQRKDLMTKLQMIFNKGYLSYEGETPTLVRINKITYKERTLR